MVTDELRTDRRNRHGDNPPIKGGGKRKNRDERKQHRRDAAAIRQAEHAGRTGDEQLAVLAARGEGNGPEAKRLKGLASW